MTLEELGYKRVEEEEFFSQIRMRYEKDITIYKADGNLLPRNQLKYCCKTILITNEGVICLVGISLDSFEFAREHSMPNPTLAAYCFQMVEPLTFDEMKAITEMIELGMFNKLEELRRQENEKD